VSKSKTVAPTCEPLSAEEKLAYWESIVRNSLEWLEDATRDRESKGTAAACRTAIDAQQELDRIAERAAIRGDGGNVTIVFDGGEASPVDVEV